MFHPASLQGDFAIAQKNAGVRQAWDECVGMTQYVGICSGEAFVAGCPAGIDVGAAVTVSDAEKFSLPLDETVQKLSMGRCICFFAGKGDEAYLRLERHPEVKEYLEVHHLRAAGNVMLYYLMLYIEEDGEDLAVACLPVKPI